MNSPKAAKTHNSGRGRGEQGQVNKRGAARLSAVQALYQMDVGDTPIQDILEQFSPRLKGGEWEGENFLPADADYFGQIIKGVLKHQLNIDPKIDSSLVPNWPVERIDATLRAVLRAGAFELCYKLDVPKAAVISEYVDVARAFFTESEPAMVNAVLDNMARDLTDRT